MHREGEEGVQRVAAQQQLRRQPRHQRVQQSQERQRQRVVPRRRLLHVQRALQPAVHVQRSAERAARRWLVDDAALLEARPDGPRGGGVGAAVGQEVAEHGVQRQRQRRGQQAGGERDQVHGGTLQQRRPQARPPHQRRQQAEELLEAVLVLARQLAALCSNRVLQTARELEQHLLAEQRRPHLLKQAVHAERVLLAAARQRRVVAHEVAEEAGQARQLVQSVVAQLQQRHVGGRGGAEARGWRTTGQQVAETVEERLVAIRCGGAGRGGVGERVPADQVQLDEGAERGEQRGGVACAVGQEAEVLHGAVQQAQRVAAQALRVRGGGSGHLAQRVHGLRRVHA